MADLNIKSEVNQEDIPKTKGIYEKAEDSQIKDKYKNLKRKYAQLLQEHSKILEEYEKNLEELDVLNTEKKFLRNKIVKILDSTGYNIIKDEES